MSQAIARCEESNLINDVRGGVKDLLVGNLNNHLVIRGAGLGAAILLILVLGAAAVVEDGDLDTALTSESDPNPSTNKITSQDELLTTGP